MKITRLRHDKPFHVTPHNFAKILAYVEGNDYPQVVKQIVTSSTTGKKCVDTYAKFINGLGISDDFIVNRKQETLNDLITYTCKDLAMFGGFALHINTNGLGEIIETQHVPFEYIRLSNECRDKVWLFDRWERWHIGKFTKLEMEKPIEFEMYTKDKVFSENGFIYYYSNMGKGLYPIPIYNASLTDMNTEEGISNILNRNARNNFLPAGFLVNINNEPESEEQDAELEGTIKQFQTDENSLNVGIISCRSKEEIPQFVELNGTNIDGKYDSTRKIIKANIGESFSQPPILRGEDVSGNIGADLIVNAYNFYNLITEPERKIIERTINYLYDTDFEIIKLKYLE